MCSLYFILFLLFCYLTLGISEYSELEAEEMVPVCLTGHPGAGPVSKRNEDPPRFRLSAFGKHFTLYLSPDARFLSQGLKVYHIGANDASEGTQTRVPGMPAGEPVPARHSRAGNKSDMKRTEDEDLRGCFYTGTVDRQGDSVVSVSVCDGILGWFISRGGEYRIEPKRAGDGTGRSATDRPHIIRRVSRNLSTTDVTDVSVHGRKDGPGDGESVRRRRFVSLPRFIETLVVADFSMWTFYKERTEHYVLTLVSVASQIFKHPSIKNSLSMVVVKMLILEAPDAGPNVSRNGGLALRHFCSWQQQLNPASQRHPEHYDTAVLFTREDICGHESCDTLGVADVGTMCDPKRSCSIIQDNGLQAAFTTAHELGHVLSMPHDESKNCESHSGHRTKHHVMASVYTAYERTSPWSPCSAFYITEFFNNGYGDCLLDVSEKMLALPTELPGVTYSLNQQCQQVFGENFSHCRNASATEEPACSRLWCEQRDSASLCTTAQGSLPWADGTTCAPHRKCSNGVCTASGDVLKAKVVVDGGWGDWAPWKPCSRSCGGGVMFSYRECDQPAPQYGGMYCVGQRAQYRSCNTRACENDHGKSFREEQCETYNNPSHTDFYGNVRRWIPKYAGVSPRDRCKLICRARGSSEFRVFKAEVTDGTTCSPDSTSICVRGQCTKAGCDLQIGSNKRLDECGVCGGDGLSCRRISGSYNKVIGGYSDIVTIPKSATNIDIKQRSQRIRKHDGNYLAVKRESGEYLLNGNFSVSPVEQDVPTRGAVLRYSGSSGSCQRIRSFGRLQETIVIQLLSTSGHASPPKIKYTFFIHKNVSFGRAKDKQTALHPFGVPRWVPGEWSECSKSCNSGWSRRTMECKDDGGFYSNDCDRKLRPRDIRPCADLLCPVWQTGPWSSCSQMCGRGERRRTVDCIDYTGEAVEKEKCHPLNQPKPVFEECMDHEC